MNTGVLRARAIAERDRFDAQHFLSAGERAYETLRAAERGGINLRTLGGGAGFGNAWSPSRFKRVYAAESEAKLPYLRPYDVFEYLPVAADWLSATRTENVDAYRIAAGTILQTCSGRNLGPAVIADRFLASFVLSHDMIRIDIPDQRLALYVLTFLRSSLGQALLRRGKSGSVIDHITPEHVNALPIPMLADAEIASVSDDMRAATQMREDARLILRAAHDRLDEQLPDVGREQPKRCGWPIEQRDITGRLDAEYYDPWVAKVRRALTAIGGVTVGSIAAVRKPPGRYRTWWVPEAAGRPILSGAQLLQAEPINLRFKSPRAFQDIASYELRAGWIAYPMDGRAEESLGSPVLVTADRDCWLASEHVGRIIPNTGVDAGAVWGAVASRYAQAQIKARCFGSIVDTTLPPDMANVILPPLSMIDGEAIRRGWDMFASALEVERRAQETIAAAISPFAV